MRLRLLIFIAVLVPLMFGNAQNRRAAFFGQKPSAGGSAPFSPPAGIKLWLKPEGLSLNDNDPVATWPDSSGLGNNVAQGTAGNRPLFKTGILNGYGVVRFDGANDFLQSSVASSSLITAGAKTVFVVLIPTVINSSIGVAFLHDVVTATAGGYWGITTKSNAVAGPATYAMSVYNFGSGDETSVPTSLAKHLIESRHESGTIYISQDGGSDASVASGDTSVLTDQFSIGGGASGGDEYGGDIAEILVFNVALSSGDRTTVRNYLNTKYAIY